MANKSLTLLKSKATTADKRWYTQGECHILAVALHRNLGWPLMVMCDHANPFYRDATDPSIAMPQVVHVYALSPDGLAWDIRGALPVNDVDKDMRLFFGIKTPVEGKVCPTERDLFFYVDNKGSKPSLLPRPLVQYSDEDVELSWDVAKQVFARLEAFESHLPKPSRRRKLSA